MVFAATALVGSFAARSSAPLADRFGIVATLIGLGVVSEVFGYDRSADGLPAYDFAVVSEGSRPVRTDTGLCVHVEHGLERAASADLVIALGWEEPDAVARIAIDGLDRGKSVIVPGAPNRVAAMLNRLAPRWVLLPMLGRSHPGRQKL